MSWNTPRGQPPPPKHPTCATCTHWRQYLSQPIGVCMKHVGMKFMPRADWYCKDVQPKEGK